MKFHNMFTHILLPFFRASKRTSPDISTAIHEAITSIAIIKSFRMGVYCWNLSHLGTHVELIIRKSSRHVILLLVDMLDGEDISSSVALVVLSADGSS